MENTWRARQTDSQRASGGTGAGKRYRDRHTEGAGDRDRDKEGMYVGIRLTVNMVNTEDD